MGIEHGIFASQDIFSWKLYADLASLCGGSVLARGEHHGCDGIEHLLRKAFQSYLMHNSISPLELIDRECRSLLCRSSFSLPCSDVL